ncbi:MAG: hypothetical protein D6737_09285 [Chloroflexi bacterium]|nr:MAG: hypothetical protein CUN54_03005 [Phototrophicales bacterium]RMF80093.1 MAG: hypothetical protein D6737_09285 [Chloroflexota bacterium]
MRTFNRVGNVNLFVGIFLLILLAVFAGPNTFPRFLSRTLPGIDEGVPCTRLRTASDLANHQSLIGRNAQQPIEVDVRTSAVPLDPNGILEISIVIINKSLGTVGFIYNPNEVLVGDDETTSGIGIIVEPPSSLNTGVTTRAPLGAGVPENLIRLLGPRQRCVHKIQFPSTQFDNVIRSGTAQVRAYYRNNVTGGIVLQPANDATGTPIYPDQGLWAGVVQSAPVTIPVQTASAG